MIYISEQELFTNLYKRIIENFLRESYNTKYINFGEKTWRN